MTGFRPIKSLGQVFLTHSKTADAIVGALELQPSDTVLEIGPGKGILTRRLVQRGCNVIGVEIDARLCELLKSKISGAPNFTVINEDILRFDMSRFSRIKIVGNLPYYISTDILIKLFENSQVWDRAVLTTQREFAARVLGKAGTKLYGVQTVICSYRYQGQRLFDIPPTFFKPSPGVVSTTFMLQKRQSPAVVVSDDKSFFDVIQAAFMPQRRKTVLNNICVNMKLTKKTVAKVFSQINLAENIRAEDMSLQQFALLCDALIPFLTSSK
ncbi:MAG: 16S rRNA (adenine(1518)-N(6)/adenine(1519)-N(6))-dimethyltransferase RsmA [bacterium]